MATTLLLLAMLATSEPALAERQPPSKPPSAMSNREIAEFNRGLASDHPYFIRCRSLDQIGSLVRKARVCRTNADWKTSERNGNDNARDTLDAMRRAPVNSSN